MGKNIWAIGDIHGYRQTLRELLDRLNLANGDRLITLGDYTDRGPDTKGVIDLLLELKSQAIELIPLQGNHEGMILALLGIDSLSPSRMNISEGSLWIKQNGFAATARSYGWSSTDPSALLEGRVQFPEEHLEFFRSLIPYIIQDDSFLCVHAGLPEVALRQLTMKDAIRVALRQRPDALTWIRETLDVDPEFPGVIIHGHTPYQSLGEYVRRPREYQFPPKVVHGKLNIDTGIICSNDPRLTAVSIPDLKLVSVPRIER